MKLDAITHVEEIGHDLVDPDDKNMLMFRRVNAAEAKFSIVDSEHYRELIRIAADGKVANAAYEELRKILHKIFDICPEACDAYLKAAKITAEEVKIAAI